MYRPLPKELTIKNSPIEGLGLFTNKDIKANKPRPSIEEFLIVNCFGKGLYIFKLN